MGSLRADFVKCRGLRLAGQAAEAVLAGLWAQAASGITEKSPCKGEKARLPGFEKYSFPYLTVNFPENVKEN